MKIDRRFSYAQHLEEEKFLEEQHAKGFKLTSIKGNTYNFEETSPLETEYLLEVPEPGSDRTAWEAYREHLGFTPVLRKDVQYYLFREKTEKRFEKKDQLYREAYVQGLLLRRVLRAFFFVILAFVVYSAKIPPEALWLKITLAGISVAGIIFFGLRALGELQALKEFEE